MTTSWARHSALALAGFCLAAFLLKLVVVLQLRAHPLLQPDVGLDTAAYAELAHRVVAGDVSLGPNLYYVSPLYIYFLASGLASTGSFTAVRVVQVALGSLAIALIFLTARAWWGKRAAWIAAGLALATGLFTFYEALILQASLDLVLTAAALYATTRAILTSTPAWWVTSGAIFALAVLNRPNMAFGAAGVLVALLVARRGRAAALLVAGLLIATSPVLIRNVVVSGQWSFGASHGGLNFYIGNHAAATGFFQPIPGITPNIKGQAEDARAVAARALGRVMDDAGASRYFTGLALTWIRTHPGDAISLFVRKLGYVASAHHIALPHSYPFYAYDAGTLLWLLPIGPWILIPMGLVGLVFCAPQSPRRRDYLVWVAFVPSYAIGIAVFFMAERYRLPLLVPLCLGSAAAIDGAWRAVSSGRVASLALPAAACVLLLAFANRPLPVHDGRWEEGLRLAEHLVTIGQYDDAETWAGRLESSTTQRGRADFGVGVQLRLAGQTARAVPHLQRAVDARIPRAADELAIALQQSGATAGAARAIASVTPDATADAETWLARGRLAMQGRAPLEAERFFRQAVQLAPNQAGARLQYGLNLLVLDRCGAAIVELGAAHRLDPKDPEPLAHLAYCEIKLGQIDAGRAHAAQALALDPAHALAKQLAAK